MESRERAERGKAIIMEWCGKEDMPAPHCELLGSVLAGLVSILYGDQSPEVAASFAVQYGEDMASRLRLQALAQALEAAWNMGHRVPNREDDS